MPQVSNSRTPARSYWIVSIVALVWNLMGVVTYLMSVMTSDEALAAMPDAERALYVDIPMWVTSAYAIAVFGGTLACVGLLLRKSWAVPVFVVSLVAILVQMGHALLGTDLLEVMGATAAIAPLLIIVIAVYLVWFSIAARAKEWIH